MIVERIVDLRPAAGSCDSKPNVVFIKKSNQFNGTRQRPAFRHELDEDLAVPLLESFHLVGGEFAPKLRARPRG